MLSYHIRELFSRLPPGNNILSSSHFHHLRQCTKRKAHVDVSKHVLFFCTHCQKFNSNSDFGCKADHQQTHRLWQLAFEMHRLYNNEQDESLSCEQSKRKRAAAFAKKDALILLSFPYIPPKTAARFIILNKLRGLSALLCRIFMTCIIVIVF